MRLLLLPFIFVLSNFGVAHETHGHEHSHDDPGKYASTTLHDPQSIIDRVKVSTKSCDPLSEEPVVISYLIRKDAEVYLDIYDEMGQMVASIDSKVKAGPQSFTWNKRTSGGQQPLGDVFLYTIKACAEDNHVYLHNPAFLTGGIQIKPLEYRLVREKNELEFVLPKACKVRIQKGIQGGMYEKSVLDWKPLSAGRHILLCNARDETGRMDFLKRKDVNLNMVCYTLPDNTIIFEKHAKPFTSEQPESKKLRQELWGTNGKFYHYKHSPAMCREPQFTVTLPESRRTTENRSVIAAGLVPVRIEISPQDQQRLTNTRFEVQMYIDGVFIYETEDATTPFTANIDMRPYARGEHVLTVNIVGYDDHIGANSQLFSIGE